LRRFYQSVGFHIPLKGSDDGVHPFYNGESVAIRTWLTERAKLNPPDEVEEFFISERRKALSRVTVWLMVKQVTAGAGLEALDVHPHSLIRFSWAIFARK
jgi:site-specific recombinase XerD